MRKEIVHIIVLVLIIGTILTIIRKRKRLHKISPTSISGGIRYDIPYCKKDSFRLSGIGDGTYTLNDLLSNSLDHPQIDHTQILYDGDLRADSGIKYVAPLDDETFKNPHKITVHLYGDLDPHQVRASYTEKKVV